MEDPKYKIDDVVLVKAKVQSVSIMKDGFRYYLLSMDNPYSGMSAKEEDVYRDEIIR